jgi:hypothetical protein
MRIRGLTGKQFETRFALWIAAILTVADGNAFAIDPDKSYCLVTGLMSVGTRALVKPCRPKLDAHVSCGRLVAEPAGVTHRVVVRRLVETHAAFGGLRKSV